VGNESIWYTAFGSLLIAGMICVLLLYGINWGPNISYIKWPSVFLSGLKIGAILTFSALLAKHYFMIARMLNNENLRLYDRRHAVNYGKTFIDIFDSQVAKAPLSKEDIHNAFRHWNIDRTPEQAAKLEQELASGMPLSDLTGLLSNILTQLKAIKTGQ
jgi:hypothetical protein